MSLVFPSSQSHASNESPVPTPPSMYHVVALNDEFTPPTFVAAILAELFAFPVAAARQTAQDIRNTGRAVVACLSYEIADTKVSVVNEVCRHEGHPLLFIIEPAL